MELGLFWSLLRLGVGAESTTVSRVYKSTVATVDACIGKIDEY